MFIEIGAWKYRHLQKRRVITTYPWTPLEVIAKQAEPAASVKSNPLERARRLQTMLDQGVAKNRADLARLLGVSRARVTQILHSLSVSDDND